MANGGYYAKNIIYTISNGYPPFEVELINSGLPINIHNEFGTYSFTGITEGNYILKITDNKDCELNYNLNLLNPPEVIVEYAQEYDDSTFYNFNGEPFTITVNL